MPQLLGINDGHLKLLERAFHVRLTLHHNAFTITGPQDRVLQVEYLLHEIDALLSQGYKVDTADLKFMIRLFREEETPDIQRIFSERIAVPSSKKRFVTPKSSRQREYVEAIRTYDIVFGIGPAGTGKTYLAMAMAVSGLMGKEFERIILARPAVEAGEKLGFLPGTLYEKVNPYLRPLYDALYDMVDFDKAQRLMEKGTIEIAPLAYMRGRTLNDSFVILDEAQNATSEQMKMFLTRLGFHSKAVITGDVTQVDLPNGKISGLIEVQRILQHVEGIRFVYFTERDVVRHELVQRIIKAYEAYEERRRIEHASSYDSALPLSESVPQETPAREASRD
ncbi:MAG: PhoH family protein [Nitrospinota bacterium]|nr:MAG: PhoH family protein [Nitrospinota bacterium]